MANARLTDEEYKVLVAHVLASHGSAMGHISQAVMLWMQGGDDTSVFAELERASNSLGSTLPSVERLMLDMEELRPEAS